MGVSLDPEVLAVIDPRFQPQLPIDICSDTSRDTGRPWLGIRTREAMGTGGLTLWLRLLPIGKYEHSSTVCTLWVRGLER